MITREDLARDAGCLDVAVVRPGPDGRVPLGPVAQMPLLAFSTASTAVNLTGGWKSVRPLYQEKLPACQDGCPADEDIARYMRAVQRGRYEEGWRLIMEDNPFPSVMGRVCYHPCEAACNRGGYDHPLAIHAVERFLGDYGLQHQFRVEVTTSLRPERIAVIGAGPAGLSAAYHLARSGYRVTIFEGQPEAGGILRWGIPPYRLPWEILRQEISRLHSLDIEIQTGAAVGRDVPWSKLEAFQAVLVATGLPRSRQILDIGDGVEGLYDGLTFLRQVAEGIRPRLGRSVVVVGGGNVAIDAARCAIRLGATDVSLVCVEPADAMPAHLEEIEAAVQEGVKVHSGFAVRQPVVINGRITALEITPVRFLGREPDGGVRFVPLGGAVAPLPAHAVIQAVGQQADLEFLPRDLACNGRLVTDGWGRLMQPMVFAAGDVVSGPGRVVDAIAAGKRAAVGIHSYLNGELPGAASDSIQTVQVGDLNLFYFVPAHRPPIPQLPAEMRRQSMAEVNGSWGEAEAVVEARRCFNCGICTGCDNCLVFCPDVAIRKNRKPYTYEVLDQYCKGCGICARECPRHVITMVAATPYEVAQRKI